MALSDATPPGVYASQYTGWNGQDQWAPGSVGQPQVDANGNPTGTISGYAGQNPTQGSVGNNSSHNMFGPGVTPGAAPGGDPTGGLPGAATGRVNMVGTSNITGAGQFQTPVPFMQNGLYGANASDQNALQAKDQRFGIQNDINYGDYQQFGNISQEYGAQGASVLTDPRAAAALKAQAAQAGGPSVGQLSAGSYQNNSLDQLQNAAAGNGPTAADIQSQRGVSEAMRAQLTAAASARGGAYAQSAAQQQASQNAAGIQAGAVSQAAQLRAQEQQQAQGLYAGAVGQAVSNANQAYSGQAAALGASTGAIAAQQNLGQNYYTQQQQAYQHQSDMAAQLAQAQVANDYGLAGTQLQTQTQQNIANQQQTAQYVGAASSGGGMLLNGLTRGSTGAAQAAAKGAREHGASETEAVHIGAHVGQAIGLARLGPAAHAYAAGDAMAARKGAMTRAEMVAYMHSKHDDGKRMKNLPGPKTEPMAAHAYAVGSHMAALAKMHRRAG